MKKCFFMQHDEYCPYCPAALGIAEVSCSEECTIKKITGECQMERETEENKNETI